MAKTSDPPTSAAAETDLSRYNNDWYQPGPRWKIVSWFLVNSLLINTYLPIPVGIKAWVLRLFGARLGQNVTIKPGVNIKYPWLLSVGNHVWIGEQVWIDNLALITIGNHVCLSQGAMLLTGNHNYMRPAFDLITKPITLENGAWIGAKSLVCPGVTVRSHAVLAAGSVATRSLEPYTIYQGNPAVAVRSRPPDGMKVTIITVVYNGAETIRDCLESVLGQSYPHLEYIVIDGGSTDGTADIVRSYGAKIAQFVSEPDGGIYDAMNKGIALATGEVIGLLNADDLYRHTDVLAHVVERLNQTGSDAVYSDMVYVDRFDLNRVVRYWRGGSYPTNGFLWGWMPAHPTLFLRRSVYERYGVFTTALRSAADYELMVRVIHKHRIKLSYLNELTVMMRVGGISNQSLGHRLRANREDAEAWRLNKLKPYFFTLWLKPLRKLGQFLRKPPGY